MCSELSNIACVRDINLNEAHGTPIYSDLEMLGNTLTYNVLKIILICQRRVRACAKVCHYNRISLDHLKQSTRSVFSGQSYCDKPRFCSRAAVGGNPFKNLY